MEKVRENYLVGRRIKPEELGQTKEGCENKEKREKTKRKT